jgi:hypothetical protein
VSRRRASLGLRCLQGIAAPAALVAVAFAVDGGWHLLEWLVAR